MTGRAAELRLEGDVSGRRVLIVLAPYYADVTRLLERGAAAVLHQAGVEIETVSVPGALEIPAAIAIATAARRFDGYVALGCVIRGETSHYDLVAGQSCRGLVDLATRERLAIGNGILTVETMRQALERADPARQDRGGHAARAAIALMAFARRCGACAG